MGQSLTSLNLFGNEIGDTGAMALAKLANLTSLDLGFNQIGDAGVVELAKLTNLKSLTINGNSISNDAIMNLIGDLADRPTPSNSRFCICRILIYSGF